MAKSKKKTPRKKPNKIKKWKSKKKKVAEAEAAQK